MIPTDPRGVWSRPSFSSGGEPGRAVFIAFLDQPVNGNLELREEGWPLRTPPPGLGTESIVVADSPAWAAWAEQMAPTLGEAMARSVRSAPYIAVVKGDVADPQDLGYLQATWAAVRWLCRRGAVVVRDDVAGAWYTAQDVLSGDPFSLAVGFQLHVGDVGLGMLGLFTLGLAKVGRRELVLFVPPDGREEGLQLVSQLASELIVGKILASGDQIELGGVQFRVEAFVPGFNGPDVVLPCAAQPHLIVIEGRSDHQPQPRL